MDRIAVGAVGVIGEVGQCAPPSIVMSLTVEPSKLRLCQDQRYLNCWMRDIPFRLDSLVTWHALDMVATHEIRNQGVPCCQYIDDRHLGQRRSQSFDQANAYSPMLSDFQLAVAANHVAVCTLTSLGYFLSLSLYQSKTLII